MPRLDQKLYPQIKALYESGFPMTRIAKHYNVTLDTVTYAMRKGKIPRRNMKEVQALRFKQKIPSFTINKPKTQAEKNIITTGVALYWAEGYKTNRAKGIDFANSDPSMILVFMKFLRTCYELDESRLRASLYAYSDQNINELTDYWSNVTAIQKSQFIKPYIRTDFKIYGRKMKYGLVHVRYNDKKLLFDIMGRIEVLRRE